MQISFPFHLLKNQNTPEIKPRTKNKIQIFEFIGLNKIARKEKIATTLKISEEGILTLPE